MDKGSTNIIEEEPVDIASQANNRSSYFDDEEEGNICEECDCVCGVGKNSRDPANKFKVIECIHKKIPTIRRSSWGATGPWVGGFLGFFEEPLPDEHWEYNTITIHHTGNTESNTPQDVEKKQKSEYVEIAYHFMIDKSGQIYEGRPLKYKGDHAYPNSHKIGIVLLGDFSEPGEDELMCPNHSFFERYRDKHDTEYNTSVPTAQKDSLDHLCSVLISCLKIEHLGGHREHTTYCRTCPGNIAMSLVKDLRNKFNLPA